MTTKYKTMRYFVLILTAHVVAASLMGRVQSDVRETIQINSIHFLYQIDRARSPRSGGGL